MANCVSVIAKNGVFVSVYHFLRVNINIGFPAHKKQAVSDCLN